MFNQYAKLGDGHFAVFRKYEDNDVEKDYFKNIHEYQRKNENKLSSWLTLIDRNRELLAIRTHLSANLQWLQMAASSGGPWLLYYWHLFPHLLGG